MTSATNIYEEISKLVKIEHSKLESIIALIGHEIAEMISEGRSVVLEGIGTFEGELQSEWISVHPTTGNQVLVPPRILLKFTPEHISTSDSGIQKKQKTVDRDVLIEYLIDAGIGNYRVISAILEGIANYYNISLFEKGEVVIPKIGRFYSADKTDKGKIVFNPDTDFASTANTPFELFECVDVEKGMVFETGEKRLDSEILIKDSVDITEHITNPISFISEGRTNETKTEKSDLIISNSEQSSMKIVQNKEIKVNKKRFKAKSYLWGLVSGIVISCLSVVVYLLLNSGIWERNRNPQTELKKSEVLMLSSNATLISDTLLSSNTPIEKQDNREEVYTEPSDQKIDTITRTRYLTTMAQEHYGNYNLWPYIYMENSKKLGDPNRIKPGTPIVIPALGKYGVDPTDKEQIKIAKKKGLEIYQRFQNK